MADFISREAAKQIICEACERPGCPELWRYSCDRTDRLNAIPAADVVEVVRCKDCRYLHNGYDEKCCINHKGVVATDENGFCHHAERRADNG